MNHKEFDETLKKYLYYLGWNSVYIFPHAKPRKLTSIIIGRAYEKVKSIHDLRFFFTITDKFNDTQCVESTMTWTPTNNSQILNYLLFAEGQLVRNRYDYPKSKYMELLNGFQEAISKFPYNSEEEDVKSFLYINDETSNKLIKEVNRVLPLMQNTTYLLNTKENKFEKFSNVLCIKVVELYINKGDITLDSSYVACNFEFGGDKKYFNSENIYSEKEYKDYLKTNKVSH